MNTELCNKFIANPSKNPKTNRKIKKDGPTYKKLNEQCKKILKKSVKPITKKSVKPITQKSVKPIGREIKKNGPTYKNLLSKPIKIKSPGRKTNLTKNQINALTEIKKRAKKESDKYRRKFLNKLVKTYEGITKMKVEKKDKPKLLDNFMKYIRSNPMFAIHFKPSVMDAFYNSGKLKNSFETKSRTKPTYIKNRENYEKEALNYPIDSDPTERPKYGCFNVMKDKKGCASYFGDYWLRLHNNKDITDRITFVAGDSLDHYVVFKRILVGTFEDMYHILYFLDIILFKKIIKNFIDPNYQQSVDRFEYLEFQIHGDITFKDNVAQLYYPKNNKREAKKFCEKYNCEIILN